MKKVLKDSLIFIGGFFIWLFIIAGIKIVMNLIIPEKNLPENYITSNSPDKSPDYPSPNQTENYPDW